MEKPTIYLIIVIILCLTILGTAGEYFAYKYYALVVMQPAINTVPNNPSNATSSASVSQQPSGSSENSIISFDLQDPLAVGKINESDHTVTITVPPGTDVTKLSPAIEISKDSTIVPLSGDPQDFTNQVAYLVTAQNGSTQEYIATVDVVSSTKSVEKLITSFALSGFKPGVSGIIDDSVHTVYAVVPDGTDLTKLVPIIKVSDGATVPPESSNIQDFTNPVTYTVTDLYGGTQNYTVTVVTESNSD